MTQAAERPAGYDAVVLAGGAGRRLGGVDKPGLPVAGVSLLARVVGAVSGAGTVVVVGAERPLAADVVWCREDPPGGGPAAGLAAALPLLRAPLTVVVAADLALLDAVTVAQLVAAVSEAGSDSAGAVAIDAAGRPQWLLGAWRTAALHDCGLRPGAALRDTLGTLRRREVRIDDQVLLDCDTPADIAVVEALLTTREQLA